MSQDDARDVLRLAEIEEAAQAEGTISADPLSFRWAVPQP
jgi:hypothetical protein